MLKTPFSFLCVNPFSLHLLLNLQKIALSMAEEALGVRRMKLGSQGLEVSVQGLGCMGLSAFYGAPTPETNAVALLRHAIKAGITFLDTSDFYGPETNELLLGKVTNW